MSKCKITGKVLVIQLGREDTQIVLMGKGAEVLHAVCVQTPAGAVEDGMIRNADAVRNMLDAAIKEEPAFKRVHKAVFTLCTSQVITETVTTPNLPDAKLEKLLQANVDMYFPVDMHEYQLTWQRIGSVVKENGMKELAVQLWAVPSAMLARYYSIGNACGLSVLAVDYCGHSIATAVGASFAPKAKEQKKSGLNMELSLRRKKTEAENDAEKTPDVKHAPETDLHLTMEKDLIGMTFVQQGTVTFQRFIRCGADPSYQLGEVAMMVEYFRSLETGRGSFITPIISGVLSNNIALMDELEDALGMPLASTQMDCDPRLVLCVGAACTTLDFGIAALNKPGKARKELQAQLWQYLLILVGGLALIGAIMLLLSSRIAWKSDIGRLESTRQTLSIQAQKTAGFADNYKSYSAKYDSYSADWDTVFASVRTYNDNLVLVLEELEEMMPKDSSVTDTTDGDGRSVYPWPSYSGVAITGLQIAADGMNIQFACENKEEAAYLIMALRELQYADLVGITDLQGGGAGPATSYGSGTEAPPTEGSSAGQSVIVELIASELTKEELAALATSLSPEQIKLLENHYGKSPNNFYTSLAELKAANTLDEETFFAKRSDTLREMLTTNPFAANRFAELLLQEDFKRGEDAILLGLIFDDLFEITQGGSSLQNLDAVVDLLVRDEETLAATEKLLCTDESATNTEAWYVYYLEVEIGMQNGSSYAFLDVNKVAADLMDNGEFNTGDDDLNGKMNDLISADTRNLLKSLNSEEEMGTMVKKYFTEGSSDSVVVDALINSYLTGGTTGVSSVDEKIKSYLASGAMDDVIGAMVDQYLTTGTTNNTIVDGMINSYLTTGTTGNADFDGIIDSYVASDAMQSKLGEMFNKYLTENTTGSKVADDLIYAYLTTGSTGNTKFDAIIDSYLASAEVKNKLVAMAATYMLTGKSGNATLDEMLDKYKATGKTGNPKIDAMLDEALGKDEPEDPTEEPTEPEIPPADYDFTDEQIKEMLDAYLTEGTTGDDTRNEIIESYLNYGNTGDEELNEKFDKLLDTDETSEQVEALVSKYVEEGTTENDTIDSIIENYLLNGVGQYDNKKLGDLITKLFDDGCFDEALTDRMDAYEDSDNPKTTGHDTLDELIEKYRKDKTTGNDKIDSIFKEYDLGGSDEDDNPFGDYEDLFTQDNINKLVVLYNLQGTTGIAKVDEQFSKYVKTGKTDYPLLDPMLKEAGLKVKGSNSIDDALSSLLGGNSGGSSGGSSIPKDTRVFFNAVIGYNDELKNAELIRKGLYYGDKIDKVEVED